MSLPSAVSSSLDEAACIYWSMFPVLGPIIVSGDAAAQFAVLESGAGIDGCAAFIGLFVWISMSYASAACW